MCGKHNENIEHFTSCLTYGEKKLETIWKEISEDHIEKQNSIAIDICKSCSKL